MITSTSLCKWRGFHYPMRTMNILSISHALFNSIFFFILFSLPLLLVVYTLLSIIQITSEISLQILYHSLLLLLLLLFFLTLCVTYHLLALCILFICSFISFLCSGTFISNKRKTLQSVRIWWILRRMEFKKNERKEESCVCVEEEYPNKLYAYRVTDENKEVSFHYVSVSKPLPCTRSENECKWFRFYTWSHQNWLFSLLFVPSFSIISHRLYLFY